MLPVMEVLLLTSAVVAAADADLLAQLDARYNDEVGMLGTKWHSPGYHTTIPNGEWVHPTRDSLSYALLLLQVGDPDLDARAARIVSKVITLQDQNPDHKTYGIWPWLMEEPLEKMSPPDWNWADFCGALLAQMLVEHSAQLDESLKDTMRDSLGHAANAIVRRDVGPGYTNIAIMGAGVTVAAGELLDEQALVEYGRNRLAKCVDHHEYHGGFNEYNSPTYTMVALHECERALQLVKDPASRAYAEQLRRFAWQVAAEHYHPGTGQWAGPHSRSYELWLQGARARYLAEQTGVEIPIHPQAPGRQGGWPELMAPLPCPPELIDRFRAVPEEGVSVRRRVIREKDEAASTWITTWLTPDVCLGSVNHDTFWTQRQVVKAYWNGGDGVPVLLRLRFLHDGVDFATGYGYHAQQEHRVLSAVSFVHNRGDFHPSLDRPKDGMFEAEDFRVRYELIGKEATASALENGRFELRAGPYCAVVHTLPGRFDGNDVRWEIGQEDGKAFVDGVCYHSERRPFRLKDIAEMRVAFGMELLPSGSSPTAESPQLEDGTDDVRVIWMGDSLAVRAPARPHSEP